MPRGVTSAEPQMQKIRAANPDAMFMAGVLTPENVLILRAYRQMGLKFPIHSSYNLSVPQYMSVAKGLLNGITFVDAYDPEKPEVKKFEADYAKATAARRRTTSTATVTTASTWSPRRSAAPARPTRRRSAPPCRGSPTRA